MDIFGEDNTIEPVDLTDVRSFCSMSSTDQSEDHLLSILISSARAELEQWVPFWIAERSVILHGMAEPRIVLRGPIIAVSEVVLKTGKDSDEDGGWTDISEECTLEGNVLTLPEGAEGPLQVEIVTGSYCPKPIQTAILMMVRNAYSDRTADPMTEDVFAMISPYRRLNS